MAHFHHRHAAAAPVEQFLADALEDGKRQRPWTCVEIVDALGGAGTDGCLGHGVAFLSRVAFCGSSGRLAIMHADGLVNLLVQLSPAFLGYRTGATIRAERFAGA